MEPTSIFVSLQFASFISAIVVTKVKIVVELGEVGSVWNFVSDYWVHYRIVLMCEKEYKNIIQNKYARMLRSNSLFSQKIKSQKTSGVTFLDRSETTTSILNRKKTYSRKDINPPFVGLKYKTDR